MGIWSSIVGGFLHHNLTAQAAKSTEQSPNATSKAAEIIDTLFTSEDERLDKQAVLARIALQSDSLQTLSISGNRGTARLLSRDGGLLWAAPSRHHHDQREHSGEGHHHAGACGGVDGKR